MLQFRGAVVASDTGMPAYRELADTVFSVLWERWRLLRL